MAAAKQAIFVRFRRAPKPRSGSMGSVTVWKRSVLSGQLNEMDLYIDPNALERWLAASPGERPFLKDEFPHLSVSAHARRKGVKELRGLIGAELARFSGMADAQTVKRRLKTC